MSFGENSNLQPKAPGQEGRLGTAIVILLLAIPMIGTIAFGAVDLPAQGIAALAVSIVVGLWCVLSLKNGEFRFAASSVQLPLIGLIVIGLIQMLPIGDPGVPAGLISEVPSASLSIEPYTTRLFVFRLFFYLLFFASALTFFVSSKRIRRTMLVLITFGAMMALFGILQRLAEPGAIYGIRPTPQAIPFASFVNQHHFASLMVLLSAPALSIALNRAVKWDKLPLLIIGLVLMTLAVVFTGSRGAMVSYVGMAGFVVAVTLVLRRRDATGSGGTGMGRLSAVAGATIFAAIIIGLAVFLGAGDGLLRGIDPGVSAGSDITSGRTHFWKTGIKIFADHPVIGTGLDTFGYAYPKYDTRNGYFRVEQAHNDYLQTLTDSGIAGFACVVAFIFLLFRQSLRMISLSRNNFQTAAAIGALAGVLGILIHSFFDFPLRTPSNGFVFLLLSAIAITAASPGASERER